MAPPKLFIILYLAITKTTARFSPSGLHFVVAAPESFGFQNSYAVVLHIAAEVEYATVYVTMPRAISDGRSRTISHNVEREKALIVNIPRKLVVGLPGVYWASFIKSSGFIRMYAFVSSLRFKASDVFVLIPERSCYKSYYVTTAMGHAFIMVMSFGSRKTEISVSFPDYLKPFRTKCDKNVICFPGANVTISLKQHQVWLLSYNDKHTHFQNTLITSNKPVFVVAGSINCVNNFNSKTRYKYGVVDLCASSMKPTEAWGKTYVVPSNLSGKQQQLYFRLNFIASSIDISFWQKKNDDGELDVIKKTLTRRNDMIIRHKHGDGLVVVTSHQPFGLYQFFEATTMVSELVDSGMLSLIPVEQWGTGIHWIDLKVSDEYRKTYSIIAQGNERDIFSSRGGVNIAWKDKIRVGGKEYTRGSVDLTGLRVKFYSNDSVSRLALYVQMHTRSAQPDPSLLSFPYDFYQNKLYHPRGACTTGKPVPGDGVDNDCDGFVDEESDNDRDDDGDGRVDEDNVEEYRDGQWSQWSSKCVDQCNGKTHRVEIRSCRNWSRFGNACPGQSIRCNETVCPKSCGSGDKNSNKDPTAACYCGKAGGCASCSTGTFLCDSCKEGLRPSRHCTSKCMENWGGEACSRIVPSVPAVYNRYRGIGSFFGIALLAAIVSGVLVGGVCYARPRRSARALSYRNTSDVSREESQVEGETTPQFEEGTGNVDDPETVKRQAMHLSRMMERYKLCKDGKLASIESERQSTDIKK